MLKLMFVLTHMYIYSLGSSTTSLTLSCTIMFGQLSFMCSCRGELKELFAYSEEEEEEVKDDEEVEKDKQDKKDD